MRSRCHVIRHCWNFRKRSRWLMIGMRWRCHGNKGFVISFWTMRNWRVLVWAISVRSWGETRCWNLGTIVPLRTMWDNGIIEEVPREESVGCGPVFYMPHRPVIRESSVSTKVRPVFDASSKGFNGLSLNDCMEVGPCLLSNLTEILLRFRR